MKKGFSAYEEIQVLANSIYKGQDVSVIASIFGDDYQITVDGKQVFSGTSDNAREFLKKVVA
jgi:hypothetical protein